MLGRKVRCCDCGFLGYHRTDDVSRVPSDPKELSARVRADIHAWLEAAVAGVFPVCLRGQEHAVAGLSPLDYLGAKSDFRVKVAEPVRCRYYYPYNPGYTPKQHLELQRERDQRQFLIKVSLLSAAIGAGIATLVNLLL